MSGTPAFKDAPMGKALITLLDAIQQNFASQAAVVGAVGAPTFPTAAAIASAAAAAKAEMEALP